LKKFIKFKFQPKLDGVDCSISSVEISNKKNQDIIIKSEGKNRVQAKSLALQKLAE